MSNPNYQYCIVGFGLAGQLLLLELLQRNININNLCILDKNFLGGSLATHYGSVVSNTPWWKTKKALAIYSTWSVEILKEGDSLFSENECMPVKTIAEFCLKTTSAAIALTGKTPEKITTSVTEIQREAEVWKISHSFGSLTCQTLFLTHGALEKQLPLEKPSIPLSIALDKQRLQQYVSAEKDKLAVFGTAHSGTILLSHLQELGIPTTAIYNTPTPFLFARDGHYDGIKEGSEKIAESILQGSYTNLKLISWNDPLEVYKALQKTTKVIYSIGFKPRPIGHMKLEYDSKTAKVGHEPNCYGFGIAFPGITEHNGQKYSDVSVLSFQEQIQRTLVNIPL
jgi:hypothetical protein